MKRILSLIAAALLAFTFAPSVIAASGWGGLGRAVRADAGSGFVERVAEKSCNNVSFMSRRCHMTFGKECAARGHSKEHCTQMSGYCHSCTDQYVRCKVTAGKTAKNGGRDCSMCNEDYGACTTTMVRYYIDKKQ